VCAGDAVIPILPSETVVVTAAILAANGRLNIWLIVCLAALGALVGDNAAYGAGRGALRRLADRLMKSERSRGRLEWAGTLLGRHGVWIIIIARFIPGGRTATTFACGTLELPWLRRFLPADATAAILWAGYASALGYIGGATFKDNLWLPLLIAAGAGLLIAALGEVARRTLLDRHERADRELTDR